MRKMWVVVTGLLCFVAQGAHSQSFEQQVRQISQKLSGAALQTRQAMAASQAAAVQGCEGCGAGAVSIAEKPHPAIQWVPIPVGTFVMGVDHYPPNAAPARKVEIQAFEMSKTLVTVAQYAECVDAGQCSDPGTDERESYRYCNWRLPGRELHPVNCVDWFQASRFAKFAGARLPSEAEWEYAARSGGQKREYPWGEEPPTCKRAVMHGEEGYGCGSGGSFRGGTMPVCSKPAGNTEQELCDMAGSLWQWVQDRYLYSYVGAPTDGSAVETPDTPLRARRGGAFMMTGNSMKTYWRDAGAPGGSHSWVGFRLARSSGKNGASISFPMP